MMIMMMILAGVTAFDQGIHLLEFENERKREREREKERE